MEINELGGLKQNRLRKTAASQYENSLAKAQPLRSQEQEQKAGHKLVKEENIIKGEIIDLRYQEVKIKLEPSGQVLSARLSGEVFLSIGQVASFLVSDKTDGQITLRFISSDNTFTSDLVHKALYGAGLAATERNIAIVQELLKFHMPVDRKTLLSIIKLSSTYKEASLSTLVLMHKNQLPIDTNNIIQFETYQKGMHQILPKLKQLVDNIGNALMEGNDIDSSLSPMDLSNISHTSSNKVNHENLTIDEEMIDLLSSKDWSILNLNKDLLSILSGDEINQTSYLPDRAIGHIFTHEELSQLHEALLDKVNKEADLNKNQISGYLDQLFDGSLPLKDLLSIVYDLYGKEGGPSTLRTNNMLTTNLMKTFVFMADYLSIDQKEKLMHLLKTKEYQKLIVDEFYNRWTLSPKDLTEKEKVRKYFNRLHEDFDRLNKISIENKLFDSQSLKGEINKLQDNLQFMRDLNELFHYIQLPLRLTANDTHADLYVFNRKRKSHNDSDQLNVLIHLDMKNLGPMDIHMTMKNKQIHAVFYMEKASEQIISSHLHELINILSNKGYKFQAKTKISTGKPDFIKDILEQDLPNQSTYRYSFDIRA